MGAWWCFAKSCKKVEASHTTHTTVDPSYKDWFGIILGAATCVNRKWYAPTCLSINQNQSVSIGINRNQSAPISINQHQSASIRINQHQLASTSINQSMTMCSYHYIIQPVFPRGVHPCYILVESRSWRDRNLFIYFLFFFQIIHLQITICGPNFKFRSRQLLLSV